jgi:hypothetical protein
VGLLVITGADGIGMLAESVTGALETGPDETGVWVRVAFPELGRLTVALLGAAGEGVDAEASEAGTLADATGDVNTADPDDRPEPEADGKTPDEVSLGMDDVIPRLNDGETVALAAGGVIEEDAGLRVSLGISGGRLAEAEWVDTDPESVGKRPDDDGKIPEGVGTMPDRVGTRPEGVGTTPDEVGTRPDEVGITRLEDSSEAMTDARLLATGRGIGAVPLGSPDTKLDTMLGATDPERTGTAEDKRLETSDTSVDTKGGRIPDGVGAADTVVGAVAPAEPEGRTPVTSETSEDNIEGTLRAPELGKTASDVGIAPEVTAGEEGVGDEAPVPSAVVIPTTMPPEDGNTERG